MRYSTGTWRVPINKIFLAYDYWGSMPLYLNMRTAHDYHFDVNQYSNSQKKASSL